MINALKESLWKQFGAGIDMIKNALLLCPDDYMNTNKKLFYTAYHVILFLDYYLTIPPKNFSSSLPFTITAPGDIPGDAIDDLIPDRIYSKSELLNYLQSCRNKCYQVIAGLTEQQLNERWTDGPDPVGSAGTIDYSVLEILLYNMRHVQHHAAQLNLILRQGINNAAGWVLRAEDDL